MVCDFPGVNDHFFCLFGIKQKIVAVSPVPEHSDFLEIHRDAISGFQQAYNYGVIREFDNVWFTVTK